MQMKRNMDLIRELLLKLEEFPQTPQSVTTVTYWDLKYEDARADEIIHHFELLVEAGFILTTGHPFDSHGSLYYKRLSWSGCDFLDSVRDPEVWRKTKEGASKAGSWTVHLLMEVGRAYAKQKLKDVTGLEL
jgi:hypothetical protein